MNLRDLLVVSLLALAFTASSSAFSFTLKGLSIGMTEGDLQSKTSMTCLPEAEGESSFDKTCATNSLSGVDYRSFAGYTVNYWGAHVDEGKVVALVIIFDGPEQPGLVSSLEEKYGLASQAENPLASLVWEVGGERLAVGTTRAGDRILTLWSIPAFELMIQRRAQSIRNDM